ncbi:ribonuclease H family protein [Candidatus Nitronereus thalassa]|uniref:ribonuclease H n=1 Tax=Candidatus Nitronereus thalassa TaxID=3020898 RepID=A0ABU3K9V6_9BACT|nr:ribonuclease H family protein [Candidatus Nitronereus thalassa]MDT7043142.1 ribonuclease H family protein [Candidatus Nitronereus thalassa]
MKFYAVRKGRVPGIYTTWDSCAAQVKGYPDAIYKSFKNQDEARFFMEGHVPDSCPTAGPDEPSPSPVPGVDIWVDGSCIHNNGDNLQLGWAYLILNGEEELHRDSGNDIPEEARSQRNVAGEIQAVLKALNWCQAQGISRATIYHDYQGLAAWVTGEWKAKTPFTQAYAATVKAYGIDVRWKKVLAHSGEKFNEIVDQLARDAARAG